MQTRHSLIVALLAAQFAMGPAISRARAQTEIKGGHASVNLEPGGRTTLEIDRPFGLVLIGDPRVIDFQALGKRSLLLKALGPGTTNLVIVDKGGIVIANLRIVVHNPGPI
ncbi:pilus assembly protein N-terminal domain-containing protein [Bradyrhizobium jicamae]|uniref:Pilus assembly protein N-terminal domain-containing protein n=2 Tax=Bradyrhizobium jicamae TaxID=280332 RepID=A0ABS5FTH0_9BRAD|nr:pilus assembly protein N-terminal domain-containing protein [Bradyrhizobium jicamae]